jgi:hypothetical protein
LILIGEAKFCISLNITGGNSLTQDLFVIERLHLLHFLVRDIEPQRKVVLIHLEIVVTESGGKSGNAWRYISHCVLEKLNTDVHTECRVAGVNNPHGWQDDVL